MFFLKKSQKKFIIDVGFLIKESYIKICVYIYKYIWYHTDGFYVLELFSDVLKNKTLALQRCRQEDARDPTRKKIDKLLLGERFGKDHPQPLHLKINNWVYP